jgi:hypothetical protein
MASQRGSRSVAANATRRFLRPVLCVAAGIVALAVLGSPADATGPRVPAPQAGSIGVRLDDPPTSGGGDSPGRIYMVDQLAPGTIIEHRMQVSNTTDRTQHLVLYGAAASIVNGGFVGADGRAANDVSRWTTVDPGSVDVAAGGLATAIVTLSVPNDAPFGEQDGVVWAEARSAANTSGGVTQVTRVGIRIYLTVGQGSLPADDFTIAAMTATRAHDGRPLVVATVHNTGGRALDLHGAIRLRSGPGGLSAGPFRASLGTSLPGGDTRHISVFLNKHVPDGPWSARLTLTNGFLARSQRREITFPRIPSPASRSTSTLWIAFVVATMIVLLTGTVVIGIRRYRAG